MKLKYFYRLDKNNKPVPGSNIKRKSKPLHAKWKEIKNICCTPISIDCTCGPRYFVQIDYAGNPIEGTLIKRFDKPEGTNGIRFAELQWQDQCCIADLTIVSVTPTNPTPGNENGSIVIVATGGSDSETANIEYSIDSGTTYQDSNTFTGLQVGSYGIMVRKKTDHSIVKTYTSNPVLLTATFSLGSYAGFQSDPNHLYYTGLDNTDAPSDLNEYDQAFFWIQRRDLGTPFTTIYGSATVPVGSMPTFTTPDQYNTEIQTWLNGIIQTATGDAPQSFTDIFNQDITTNAWGGALSDDTTSDPQQPSFVWTGDYNFGDLALPVISNPNGFTFNLKFVRTN